MILGVLQEHVKPLPGLGERVGPESENHAGLELHYDLAKSGLEIKYPVGSQWSAKTMIDATPNTTAAYAREHGIPVKGGNESPAPARSATGRRPGRPTATMAPASERAATTAIAGANPSRKSFGEA